MRFAEQRVEGAVGGAEVAGGAEVDERVDDGDFVFRHAHAGEVGEGHVVALQDFARLVGLAELDEDVQVVGGGGGDEEGGERAAKEVGARGEGVGEVEFAGVGIFLGGGRSGVVGETG